MMNDVEAGKSQLHCDQRPQPVWTRTRDDGLLSGSLCSREKQVRYIAIAENEDTEKGLSEFVPFKNLFNEWFAKGHQPQGKERAPCKI